LLTQKTEKIKGKIKIKAQTRKSQTRTPTALVHKVLRFMRDEHENMLHLFHLFPVTNGSGKLTKRRIGNEYFTEKGKKRR
jgi:hypothetical protein